MHTDWDAQRERLSAYLDDEVSAEERVNLEAHLSRCAECQRELAALRQLKALLGAMSVPMAPRSFALPENLRPLPAPRAASPRWSRPLQALGSLAAVIGLGFLITSVTPHIFPTAMGGATSSSNATYGGISSGAQNDGPTTSSTATPKSPGANSGIGSPEHAPAHSVTTGQQEVEPFPVLPVTGGVLLVGGVAAFTLGSLARRRSRGAGLPEPAE